MEDSGASLSSHIKSKDYGRDPSEAGFDDEKHFEKSKIPSAGREEKVADATGNSAKAEPEGRAD